MGVADRRKVFGEVHSSANNNNNDSNSNTRRMMIRNCPGGEALLRLPYSRVTCGGVVSSVDWLCSIQSYCTRSGCRVCGAGGGNDKQVFGGRHGGVIAKRLKLLKVYLDRLVTCRSVPMGTSTTSFFHRALELLQPFHQLPCMA